jgi:hypothetical protein
VGAPIQEVTVHRIQAVLLVVTGPLGGGGSRPGKRAQQCRDDDLAGRRRRVAVGRARENGTRTVADGATDR